jgi:hypothetical protein
MENDCMDEVEQDSYTLHYKCLIQLGKSFDTRLVRVVLRGVGFVHDPLWKYKLVFEQRILRPVHRKVEMMIKKFRVRFLADEMDAIRILVLVYFLISSGASLHAFPPAPHYTIYGTVRDQVGQRLTAEGAVLSLLKGGLEIGRTPINSALLLDQNYELSIRIDQNLGGTTLYSDKALAALGLFSLVVEMNGAFFYPIEVSGNLRAGKGGERVRLDLNLGEDLDRDGLPDAWEQWQLYQAGFLPDVDGNWQISLINRDGDFDGDGSSNLLEYIAGTFAGDATEKFALSIKEKLPTSVRFEFYGITGKSYTIESSIDLKNWTRVPFSIAAPTAGSISFTATDVGILTAFTATTPGDSKQMYRLSVR